MSRLLRTSKEILGSHGPALKPFFSRNNSIQNSVKVRQQVLPLSSSCSSSPFTSPDCPLSGSVSTMVPVSQSIPSPRTQMIASFYRRELPVSLVSFTSYLGRHIFKEALDANMVENYFSLVGNFTTQSETACILKVLSFLTNRGRLWAWLPCHGIKRNGS